MVDMVAIITNAKFPALHLAPLLTIDSERGIDYRYLSHAFNYRTIVYYNYVKNN